jgi:hypothetical protein
VRNPSNYGKPVLTYLVHWFLSLLL